MTYIPNSIEARDVASLVHMQTNLRTHQKKARSSSRAARAAEYTTIPAANTSKRSQGCGVPRSASLPSGSLRSPTSRCEARLLSPLSPSLERTGGRAGGGATKIAPVPMAACYFNVRVRRRTTPPLSLHGIIGTRSVSRSARRSSRARWPTTATPAQR